MELKDIDKNLKNKYSYQYMDSNNNLIFRYDNSEHYPDLPNFPHHKHISENILSSKEPNLIDVLKEIYIQYFKS